MSMSITISNFSKAKFTTANLFDGKSYKFTADGTMEMLSQAPSDTIEPEGGQTKMVTKPNLLKWFENCVCDIGIGYNCSTGKGFSIVCHQQMKVLGIGADPTWEIYDGLPNFGSWVNLDHSVSPYIFKSMPGITITATPSVTPGNIDIDVIIKDKKE